jgi:hypothetical protein
MSVAVNISFLLTIFKEGKGKDDPVTCHWRQAQREELRYSSTHA